jgi:hypothetical protein
MVATAATALDTGVLLRATGYPGEILVESISALKAEHLVRTRRDGERDVVETYHDRIRERVRDLLSGERARACHLALAEALSQEHDADPEVLASHYRAAGELSRARAYAERAAFAASTALAFDRAVLLWRTVVELTDPSTEDAVRVRIQLGEALVLAGRGADAADVYLDVVDRLPLDARADVLRRASEQLLFSGHIDRGMALLDRSLASTGMSLRSPVTALLFVVILRAWLYVRGLGFPTASSTMAPSLVRKADAAYSAAWGLLVIDNVNAGYFILRALCLALRLGDRVRIAQGCLYEAGIEMNSARTMRARRRAQVFLELGERLAAEAPHDSTTALLRVVRGMGAVASGDWAAACSLLDEGVAMMRRNAGMSAFAIKMVDVCEWLTLRCETQLGRYADAEFRRARLRREADERGDVFLRVSVEFGRNTVVDLAYEKLDHVRSVVPAWLEKWSARHDSIPRCNGVMSLAMLDLYEGSPRSAADRIRRHWDHIRASSILLTTVTDLFVHHIYGVARLSGSVHSEQRRAAREVYGQMRRLSRHNPGPVQPYLVLFRGACSAVDGKLGEWRHCLETAAAQFDERGMVAYGASCRHRLGALLDGEEGRILQTSTEAELTSLGVKRPSHFVRLFVPDARPA